MARIADNVAASEALAVTNGVKEYCVPKPTLFSLSFGRVINTEMTVVMHQPPPDAAYVAYLINVNGAKLQAVGNFNYLGSTLSRMAKID
ncbi:hypothetical protein SprV_0501887300 [Sparganum proliferum]